MNEFGFSTLNILLVKRLKFHFQGVGWVVHAFKQVCMGRENSVDVSAND